MKEISLLRHAKSSWDKSGLDDLDRPLEERGWKAARKIGTALERRSANFDLVIASPAARVRETIDGLGEKLRIAGEIRFDEAMYLASSDMLLEMVRALPESVRSPLLVGHNPGLQQFLVAIANGPSSLLDKVATKFPTAAFAKVRLPAHRWRETSKATGEIAELILPRELD